jgi:hypothetical protein
MTKKLSFLHELCWLRGFRVSGKISQDSQPGLNMLVFVWHFKEPLRTAANKLSAGEGRWACAERTEAAGIKVGDQGGSRCHISINDY